ncbi:MAG TPA: hypothetical protein VJS92_04295 [Candidatus Polarisedimenticolaceae bacterium]|nr:hypothetical protein [Candidatus Polarisedimenticolaceae bacterium]
MNSAWRLRRDIVSIRALLWLTRSSGRGEPTPDVHLYFYDRYWRLAQHHARAGRGPEVLR